MLIIITIIIKKNKDGYMIPEGRFSKYEFLREVLKGEKKVFFFIL